MLSAIAIAYDGIDARSMDADGATEEISCEKSPNDGCARSDLSEIEVLGWRCQEGDSAAWAALFPVVWPVLVRFVNRLYHVFDEEDAEDVAQSSLEAAIRGIESFSGRGLFRAWLFGIASQQARTLYRRKLAAKRGLTLLVPMSVATDRHDEGAVSPVEALAVNDRLSILHKALEDLSDDERDLVHLHFFGDLTFKEIAAARNLNPKTVFTRWTRCKEKLLNALQRSDLTRADG